MKIKVLIVDDNEADRYLASRAFAESGLAGYESTSWYGILAPARTPPAVVTRLHEVIVSILASADIKDKFAAQGLDPVGAAPREFEAVIKSEITKWAKVVKASGARPE